MKTTVLRHLASLADPTRARLILALERHELAVAELCDVVQLPQSTVSRHLRLLSDEGWLASRAEGTSRYYRVSAELEPEARALWEVVREPLQGATEAAGDEERSRAVVRRRRSLSQEFFATSADRWDSVRRDLFGEAPEIEALLALLDPGWEVGDLGCGTGGVAVRVARYVKRVVAVDESEAMLAAARERAARAAVGARPVEAVAVMEFRQGHLESLPIADASLDVALLVLVLHYVAQPERALAETWRVLRPGGRVLVVDMEAHGRPGYAETMGHLWPGFEWERMEGWLRAAGFTSAREHHLPPQPGVRGPMLFASVATKQGNGSAAFTRERGGRG
jgi:ubiquinone/menaquinone biosynthesis C-methylase UbiE